MRFMLFLFIVRVRYCIEQTCLWLGFICPKDECSDKKHNFFCAAKGRCPVAAQYCRHEQKKAKLNEGWNVLFLLAFFRAVRRVSLIRSDDKLFLCLPSTKKRVIMTAYYKTTFDSQQLYTSIYYFSNFENNISNLTITEIICLFCSIGYA